MRASGGLCRGYFENVRFQIPDELALPGRSHVQRCANRRSDIRPRVDGYGRSGRTASSENTMRGRSASRHTISDRVVNAVTNSTLRYLRVSFDRLRMTSRFLTMTSIPHDDKEKKSPPGGELFLL